MARTVGDDGATGTSYWYGGKQGVVWRLSYHVFAVDSLGRAVPPKMHAALKLFRLLNGALAVSGGRAGVLTTKMLILDGCLLFAPEKYTV